MLRRLKARLEWDGSEEHKLDYIKTDDMKCAQCVFIPKVSSVLLLKNMEIHCFSMDCVQKFLYRNLHQFH